MPTQGFGDGVLAHDGIEFLPVDEDYGNNIVKWHVQHTGAELVITRGPADRFTKFRGSEFRWVAWYPGGVSNRILRNTRTVLVGSDVECGRQQAQGIHSRVFAPAVLPPFAKEPEKMASYFREAHGIPEDAFLITAVGPTEANFTRLLEGFAKFRERHEDAILYLHTNWDGPPDLGACGVGLALPPPSLRFPDPYNYHAGYPLDVVAGMYSASAVHVVPGLRVQPIVEALACGTPVIMQRRPETEDLVGVDGLGAVIEPATWHDGKPILSVDALVRELENAYAMSGEAMAKHRACCQMVARQYAWSEHWRNDWKPLLKDWEEEIAAREERLKFALLDTEKLDTNLLEDRGDVVRKYDTGGSERDERAMNAIVKALGPHPNIVPILEEGEDEFGRYYFDTPKLKPLTEIKEFTEEEAGRILADVRAGAEFLNSHGIAHRDLNPKNILLDGAGTAKIFDFDWIEPGLHPEMAHLCDFEPLDERVREYAVPVMACGLATRGFHRVVTYVRNLRLDASRATSNPDTPYQQIDAVGERDCGLRWEALKPDVAGKRVLDLGCNLGYFASRSLDEGAADVLAIDRDKAILAAAEKVHPNLAGKTARINLEKTLPEGEFDVAFCLSVWQHLGDGKRGLLAFLKTIPVVYWEDVNLTKGELEHMGFEVERIGFSDLGRNLFKLTCKDKVPA
jgi:glycosyltransferase involved in cell wall biosynthesis